MSSPAVLVTLEQAKEHLRIRHTEEDNQVQDKLDAAEDAVLDYLGIETPEWDDSNVPPRVVAAILIVLEDLWRFRGGDEESFSAMQRAADGELPVRATRLLHRLRELALA